MRNKAREEKRLIGAALFLHLCSASTLPPHKGPLGSAPRELARRAEETMPGPLLQYSWSSEGTRGAQRDHREIAYMRRRG